MPVLEKQKLGESDLDFAKRFAGELVECIEVLEIEDAKGAMDLMGSLSANAGGVDYRRIQAQRNSGNSELAVDTLIYKELAKLSRENDYLSDLRESANEWMSYYAKCTSYDVTVHQKHSSNFQEMAEELSFKLGKQDAEEIQNRDFLGLLKGAESKHEKMTLIRERLNASKKPSEVAEVNSKEEEREKKISRINNRMKF